MVSFKPGEQPKATRLRVWRTPLCALVICLGAPTASQARPRSAECRAAGPPGRLDAQAPFASLSTLQYDGDQWLVLLDRTESPKSVRLVSSRGRHIGLSRPPRFAPSQWFGRGSSIYALGTARSLEEGMQNVVLVRWAMDGRRPRLIRLWAQPEITTPPTAILTNATLAVGWASKQAGAKEASRWTLGVVDMERMQPTDPLVVGKPARRTWGRLMLSGSEIVALWIADNEPMTARFDQHGSVVRKATGISWPGDVTVTATAQCGAYLYAIDRDKNRRARLSLLGQDGPQPLTTFDAVEPGEVSLTCTGNAAVVGHRVWNDRAGSVVFWVSTVAPSGKVRARRVRDIKGRKDDLRMTTIAGSGDDLAAWWMQKSGGRSELYTRRVGCK
ncbi:MAG: hypothetical protein OXR73_15335 [Myxococcales bacterium]|nr:hypothetical protein [Myxococcales bacterium]